MISIVNNIQRVFIQTYYADIEQIALFSEAVIGTIIANGALSIQIIIVSCDVFQQ